MYRKQANNIPDNLFFLFLSLNKKAVLKKQMGDFVLYIFFYVVLQIKKKVHLVEIEVYLVKQ